jgi:hypothetical protein
VTNVTLNARLAGEPREWTRPSFAAQYYDESGMEWRYGIVDNLNLKCNNVVKQPLSLTVGRQDMMLGDFWNWWLVADGTPGDGSWTYFFDAARATYDAKEIKTKFDLVYIYQNARADEWMPTIGSPSHVGTDSPLTPTRNEHGETDYPLTEQNEQGVIAYASNKSIKNTTLDGYFIYKRDDQETFKRFGSEWVPGDNANIYTLGVRITGTPADHWLYSVEGAYQLGDKEDFIGDGRTLSSRKFDERDLAAYGGNARVAYLFKDSLNNQVNMVFEYLSGDDGSSDGTDEMFDILWGRWPRYSELYLYSYAAETNGRIGQHNNLIRVGPGWTLAPTKKMTLGAYYNALFAPQEEATRAANPALFSGDGSFRGHFAQGVLQYTFSRHVKGHLWAECVWEGDYYNQRDLMTFLRAEVLFTF